MAQRTSAIALRMAGVGFVTVSLRRSIIFPLYNAQASITDALPFEVLARFPCIRRRVVHSSDAL